MGSDMETMSFYMEKDQRIFLIEKHNYDLQNNKANFRLRMCLTWHRRHFTDMDSFHYPNRIE